MNNDNIRQRVLSIYAKFTTDVDPDRLSDYLKQDGIISIAQWQDICSKNSGSFCRCRALLDLLLTGSNPKAFVAVRNALEKENHYLLGAIDEDTPLPTEDKKTIKILELQLQNQIKSTQVLERRVEEAEFEINKLRRKVDELESEHENHQSKEERPLINTNSKSEGGSDVIDREFNQKLSCGNPRLVFAERSESIMYLTPYSAQSRKQIILRRSVSVPNHAKLLNPEELVAMRKLNADVKESETESESYSDIRDRDTARRRLRNNSRQDRVKPTEPVMQLTEDSEPPESGPNNAILRSRGRRSDSTIFNPLSRTAPLASKRYEPCEIEQKSATLRPRNNKSSASSSINFSTIGRKSPLMPRQLGRTEPYLIKEIKTKASTDNGKAIHGIAILDTELFIISRVSSDIEVHDINRLSLVRHVKLNILEAPWDIVSCKINKCLYIMNWKASQSKTIVRVHPNETVIKEWSTGRNCGRLSITQESNIILADCNTDQIIEYTAEGRLAREINLS